MGPQPIANKTFRFTSQKRDGFPLSAPELRELARRDLAGASAEDTRVMGEILESLEHRGELPFAWTPQEHLFLQRHGTERIVPYLVYRYKVRVYPERHIVADFPVYLLIEPSSACNLRCTMCFQVDKSFTRKPYMGVMDMGLYRAIIDQAAEGGTRALTFASRGEPLLNKKLGEMLRYAADKGTFLEIKLNTNGTGLDDKACDDILSAGVSIVVVSIDSIDPAEYGRIRVGGDFNQVLSNVRRLRDRRDRLYLESSTEIRVSGVKLSPEQSESRFDAFWSQYADTVAMVDVEERWDTYSNIVHDDLRSPCSYLWERMYVWYDGICNPCDLDYKSRLVLGDARGSTLRDIWHGEAYTRMRQHHLDGKRSAYNPCDRCGVS